MTSPYLTSRIAEQRVRDLVRQAHKDRLCRMAGKRRPEVQPARSRRWLFSAPVPRSRSALA
jgi:hypothetical protein